MSKAYTGKKYYANKAIDYIFNLIIFNVCISLQLCSEGAAGSIDAL